jgi:hypothetical protein
MSHVEFLNQIIAMLKAHSDAIDQKLERLALRPTERASYTIEELAALIGRAVYTVREWCRHGQLAAEKTATQSGPYARWTISHSEYLRFQREGLLPIGSAAVKRRLR